MKNSQQLNAAFRTVKNLFQSLKEENLVALIPIVVLVLALAIVLVCLKLSAPIAPFVYSLF
jgi:hypothetical protein